MNIITQTGPGLVLGIPVLRRPVSLEWAMAWKQLTPPINFNTNFHIVQGKPIADARNEIVEFALNVGAKYLFFLSDDVEVPPHTLRQLIFRMENNPEIGCVGGVYCSKSNPPAPLVFRGNGQGSYWDWKVGEFFQCSGLGMDCTLIRTSILEKLPEPWFKTVDNDSFMDGIPGAESWTEDLYFCKKVTDAGFGIFCDSSVMCTHDDVYSGKSWKLPKDSLPMRQKGVVRDKRCLILGPGISLSDEYDQTRCTQDSDHLADYRLSYDNLPFDKDQFDFVVITDHILDIERHLPEWRRVTKSGCKIAINLHPALSQKHALEKFGAQLDGSFLEITKE